MAIAAIVFSLVIAWGRPEVEGGKLWRSMTTDRKIIKNLLSALDRKHKNALI